MKEIVCDVHGDMCNIFMKNNPDSIYKDFCTHNPTRFLFFSGNNFFLITYFNCLEHYGDTYDFKKDIINRIIEKHKIFSIWEIERGINLKKEFSEIKYRDAAITKKVHQVNYIYEDMCGREYAITTTVKLCDVIMDQELIDKNYSDCVDFLLKNNYDYLIPSAERLYRYNSVRDCNDIEFCNTIDHLLLTIKKQINGNC